MHLRWISCIKTSFHSDRNHTPNNINTAYFPAVQIVIDTAILELIIQRHINGIRINSQSHNIKAVILINAATVAPLRHIMSNKYLIANHTANSINLSRKFNTLQQQLIALQLIFCFTVRLIPAGNSIDLYLRSFRDYTWLVIIVAVAGHSITFIILSRIIESQFDSISAILRSEPGLFKTTSNYITHRKHLHRLRNMIPNTTKPGTELHNFSTTNRSNVCIYLLPKFADSRHLNVDF